MQYQRLFVQKLKDIRIDKGQLKKFGEIYQIIINNKINEEQANELYREVQNSQEELKVKGKEIRERELLDFSKSSIKQENVDNEKQRKRIIKGISESMKR